MKQQLIFAFKLFTLAGVYLFTRSRTPTNKLKHSEKSLAVLFLLEHLKKVYIFNARLIKDSKNQVEILENDIRLFKAFLKDCAKRSIKDEDLKELVADIKGVVAEGEDVIVAYSNQAAEIRAWNFFQKAFGGQMQLIRVANDVRAMRAKVKNIYDKSSDFFYNRRRIGGAAREEATDGGGENKKGEFVVALTSNLD